jgi:hypothetical protein
MLSGREIARPDLGHVIYHHFYHNPHLDRTCCSLAIPSMGCAAWYRLLLPQRISVGAVGSPLPRRLVARQSSDVKVGSGVGKVAPNRSSPLNLDLDFVFSTWLGDRRWLKTRQKVTTNSAHVIMLKLEPERVIQYTDPRTGERTYYELPTGGEVVESHQGSKRVFNLNLENTNDFPDWEHLPVFPPEPKERWWMIYEVILRCYHQGTRIANYSLLDPSCGAVFSLCSTMVSRQASSVPVCYSHRQSRPLGTGAEGSISSWIDNMPQEHDPDRYKRWLQGHRC